MRRFSSAAILLLASCARQPIAAPPPAPAPQRPPVAVVPAPVVRAPAAVVTRTPAVSDSTVPFERPNGTLLRASTLVYDLSLTRAGQPVALGIRTVSVVESQMGGAPGWLISETRTGTALETSDSLFVSRTELTPTRWAASVGKTQLAASMTRDTLFGAMQTYQGRSSFTIALPPGVLLTPGMVERVVELLPLQLGYRAAAAIVLLELGSPRAVAAQLAVDREERLSLASGTVDCWVVTLRAGAMEERLWVSKEPSRVVKTEQTVATGVVAAMLRM